MRWYLLRTLLYKEVLRHLANRGALALIGLLLAAAMLLSFFGKGTASPTALLGGTPHCWIDYWEEGPWLEHLRSNVPDSLKERITFRHANRAAVENGKIVYPPGHGAIQLRVEFDDTNTSSGKPGNARIRVHTWHTDSDGSGLAPYEAWFWKESHRFLQQQVSNSSALHGTPEILRSGSSLKEERNSLEGATDPRAAIATSLVLFGVFFVCVYLLPSLTCEERERGVLLAQALSPASPLEILAARFLFYPVVGIGLAASLAGIYQPSALVRPFFWLALLVSTIGSMGIGLTIASLARTQRSASMAALCYMMSVAMLLLICQQNGIPFLPWLTMEYHCPRMMQAVLGSGVKWYHWGNLGGAGVLAVGWAGTATVLFRYKGWQ